MSNIVFFCVISAIASSTQSTLPTTTRMPTTRASTIISTGSKTLNEEISEKCKYFKYK